MINITKLNINESGNPVSRKSPTFENIESFEKCFEVSLSSDLLTLLNYSNGGHPELDTIIVSESDADGKFAVDHFYHLDNDRDSPTSLWRAMLSWRNVLGKQAIPFAEDGGGNPFFLDLTTNPNSVKICIHDDSFRKIWIAESFNLFIQKLSVDPEDI